MLRRLPASMPDRAVLGTPGFAWWYLDLVDGAGNGLVLIWSFGLPFLPDLDDRADRRPSLNLCVYERGRPVFYTLQEVEASWEGGAFRFGRSTLTTSFVGRDWTFEAHLDGDLPAGRFTGTIRACGREVRAPEGGAGVHEWAMLATGTAEADIEADGHRYALRGRCYHDRNSSPVRLGALGIREWWWGRIPLPGHDLVFYRLIGADGAVQDHVLRVGEETRAGEGPLLPEGRRASLYGPTWPARIVADGLSVELGPAVDEGPFYVRLLARIGEATGYAEIVCADRVGVAWHKPFVRMAVQRPSGNSMWLPLFAGPDRGRFARLARWWAQ